MMVTNIVYGSHKQVAIFMLSLFYCRCLQHGCPFLGAMESELLLRKCCTCNDTIGNLLIINQNGSGIHNSIAVSER